MPHIFDLLHEDHQKVAEILKQLERTANNELDERASLIELAREKLETHARFEEEKVYPAIQNAVGVEKEIRDAVNEHAEALHLLSGLSGSVQDVDWNRNVQELTAAIEHHVKEEEEHLFPQAREKLSQTEGERLAENYRELKRLSPK